MAGSRVKSITMCSRLRLLTSHLFDVFGDFDGAHIGNDFRIDLGSLKNTFCCANG